MNDPEGLESHRDLALLIDHVLPLLPPCEFNVYLLLLRLTHAEGTTEIRIGNRTISARLGRMTRSSGGNYNHITDGAGALTGALTIARDTSEQKLRERYLKKRQPRLGGAPEHRGAAAGPLCAERGARQPP
ncbi:MAG: hypothetical protein M3417_04595 [Actinomycetota bacterium]|nr:hypothetical protein [Actinomycetota bacterium]